jgi:hypothetical protein
MTTPTEPLPSTLVRHGRLMEWLRANPGTTTYRISVESPAYEDERKAWYSSPSECAGRDLKALHRKGLVVREGRPAKWRVA